MDGTPMVALRKESVDRNYNAYETINRNREVALRKESVDRNSIILGQQMYNAGRSPQGERG